MNIHTYLQQSKILNDASKESLNKSKQNKINNWLGYELGQKEIEKRTRKKEKKV